jgi:hypothetical protein
MPRRPDSIEAFWLDPHGGFSGYPSAIPTPETGASQPKPTVRAAIEEMEARRGPGESPAFAVIQVRDKLGFRFERAVGLDEYVSQREAARILDLPVMTINRAVRSKQVPSRTKKGYSVILLRDVLKEAKRRGRRLKMRGRLMVVGERG